MSQSHNFIIHIGFHKTGSTALQAFLGMFRQRLISLGQHFYLGGHLPNNHVELHAAAMRNERDTPFKLRSHLQVDGRYRTAVRERIHRSIQASTCTTHLFSGEGISYLRFEDEFDRLKWILPPGNIRVVAYIRNRAAFRASYALEMKDRQFPMPLSKESVAYIEEDSWLLDFEARIAEFRKAFGMDHVTTFDYDAEVNENRSIIPSFLNTVGLSSAFNREDWDRIYINRTRRP